MNKFLAKIEVISLLFILLIGLTTFFWFVIYLLGISFNLLSLLVAFLLSLFLSLELIKVVSPPLSVEPKVFTPSEKLLLWLTGLLAFSAIIISLYNPISSWDSLTLYDFRGLLIAQSHSLAGITSQSYYLSYPLMTSLLHAAVYQLSFPHPLVFYALIYLSLLGIVYGRTRSSTKRSYAILATFLTASNSILFEHASIAYTNLPYSLYLVSAFLYAPTSLILSGVLVGLSTWVRFSEPFWLAGIIYICLIGWQQKKFLSTIVGIFSALTIRFSWMYFLSTAYQNASLVDTSTGSIYNFAIFAKIYANSGSIISYLSKYIFTPYLGVWALAFFVFIPAFKARSKLYLAFLLLVSMIILGTAVFSTYFSSWYSIGGSATRMVLFLVPLITVIGIKLYYKQSDHHDQ